MGVQGPLPGARLRLAGSSLAITRLKEVVSEITKVAKTDLILGAEGAVALMERLWPALQDIDTSSGALGGAVHKTLDALIPILIKAPADPKTCGKWLERLYEAVQEDGVQYLTSVEERWGEIAVYPEHINAYADRLPPSLRRLWLEELDRLDEMLGMRDGALEQDR